MTSFITRSTLSDDRHFYERWPEQPVDLPEIAAAFAPFGLPERLEEG